MIIDKIQISGTSYDVKDASAVTVVDILQADYDELPESAKTSNILYNITDAQPIDISQYWTSAQTNSAITEAVSGKLDTSTFQTYSGSVESALGNKVETSAITTAVTTGSTDSEIPTAKAVNDAIAAGGGGITSGEVQTMIDENISGMSNTLTAHTGNTQIHVTTAQTAAWDAKSDFSGSYNDLTDKPTIPTTTSAITSGSTDVVTSGGVYDQMGGMKIVHLTQAQYDQLQNKDNMTLYVITNS